MFYFSLKEGILATPTVWHLHCLEFSMSLVVVFCFVLFCLVLFCFDEPMFHWGCYQEPGQLAGGSALKKIPLFSYH